MKPKHLIFVSLFISVFMSSSSCVKDEQNPTEKISNGMVLYGGSPATDGCGWVILTDTAIYAPIELETEFKVDSLDIIFDCEILDTWRRCGWMIPGYQEIEIISIENLKN